MDLAIHILEAILLFGLAVCLFITYLISEEQRKIAIRLANRLEELEKQKKAEEQYREAIKAANERMMESIRTGVEKWIKDKTTLNVTDGPLDFPNDHKD